MVQSATRTMRRLVPNVLVRVRHVEPELYLSVRLRQHLGLIARGSGRYEPRYVKVLRSCVEVGDVVFDVGANIGFYATLFGRWVGSGGGVVAYEPDPDNARLLRRNLAAFPASVVRPVALGSTTGVSAFSRDGITGQTGHIGAGPTYGEVQFRGGKQISIDVSITTLDAEVERMNAVPDVVKIDAEGAEYEILCGGQRLMRSGRPLIVAETSNWRYDMKQTDTPSGAVIELLRNHEYVVYDLDRGLEIEHGEQPWMVLAVPDERRSEPRMRRVIAETEALS